MATLERLTVLAPEAGTRADAFVARRLPPISRRQAKQLASEGAVRRDGKRLRPSDPVLAGDTIEVELAPAPSQPLPTVAVLFEDDDFLYLNKPPGVHTVRLRPSDPPTLADVARHLDPGCANASEDPREAGAVHRLDLATSGVVVFARSRASWHRGRAALRDAWKLYLARPEHPPAQWPPPARDHVRVHPEPPRWPAGASLPRPRQPGVQTTWPLSGAGPRGHRVQVDEAGLPAASRVWPLDPAASVFAVELLSGRRHQVRVHMAQLGLPLAGDALYGSAPEGAHVRLHAWAYQLGPQAPVVLAEPPAWCSP